MTLTRDAVAVDVEPVAVLRGTHTIASLVNNESFLEVANTAPSLVHLQPSLRRTPLTLVQNVESSSWRTDALSALISHKALVWRAVAHWKCAIQP